MVHHEFILFADLCICRSYHIDTLNEVQLADCADASLVIAESRPHGSWPYDWGIDLSQSGS